MLTVVRTLVAGLFVWALLSQALVHAQATANSTATSTAALSAAAASPRRAEGPTEAKVRRVDDRRPEQPRTVSLWSTPVELSGSWEYSDERRHNFDLNLARERNRRVREHEFKLEARALLGADFSAFVQAVGVHELRRTQGTVEPLRTRALERGEMWLQWDRLGGTAWALQVGRVPLIDRRAWWWDDDLDAVRLRYADGPWRLDTGLSRTLARVSSADSGIPAAERGVLRHWGQAGWTWAPRHTLEAFWLLTADRSGTPVAGSARNPALDPDKSDLRGRWRGLRASGEARWAGGSRFSYWADAARLSGSELRTAFSTAANGAVTAGATQQRRVRGNGLDLGATFAWGVPLRPSLTLGYARGSGGEDSDTLDANFRQTGLHENKARLAGVKRLRRYGALLQPDLSNLAVHTAATGLRVLSNSSIELVLHRYRQGVPSAAVAGSRLSQAPLGLDTRLGREIDLFIALREWSRLELTLGYARFTPGAAFAANRRDSANALEVGLAVNF